MAHPFIFLDKRRPVYTIEDFATLEIPASEPNESGVFTEKIYVDIPAGRGYAMVLGVAKDSAGMYHVGIVLGTPTGGGGFAPSRTWNSFRSKEEAFLEGLKLIEARRGFEKFRKHLRDAKREYFNSAHRQLELF